eukprot:4093631-Amphidinium_carterae.1
MGGSSAEAAFGSLHGICSSGSLTQGVVAVTRSSTPTRGQSGKLLDAIGTDRPSNETGVSCRIQNCHCLHAPKSNRRLTMQPEVIARTHV